MWWVIIIIGITLIIVYNTSGHGREMRRINKKTLDTGLTPEANTLMSDFHKDFTKGQRYAYYNLLSALAECHINSSITLKKKVDVTLRQTEQFLNISPDQADAYLRIHGVSEMCMQLGSLPKGAQLHSIISTAFGIASSAEGYIDDNKANECAMNLLVKIFEEAGISENELEESLEKTALLMSKFM